MRAKLEKWIRDKADAIIGCRVPMFLKIIICALMTPVMIAGGAVLGLSIGFMALPVTTIFLAVIILPISFMFSFEADYFLLFVIAIYGSIILGALAGAFVTADLSRKYLFRKQQIQ